MPGARRVLAGPAALPALAGAGCGGEKADLPEPAMALPRLTVAMVAVDLRGGDRDQAGALARAAGYRSPLFLAGPAARAVAPDADGPAALFLLPARDGTGLNSGAVVETRDERAALDAARRVRPLVRAERARRGGVVRGGSEPLHALARLRASPTAAAAVGRWVGWGDPRAVRAAVVAANGLSLGETVPFRRAVEAFRGQGPGLVYVDPRPLGAALMAGALGVGGGQGGALSDLLLGVRFARPIGGALRLHAHHVSIDTGAEDGCPLLPLADAGGAPAPPRVGRGGAPRRRRRRRRPALLRARPAPVPPARGQPHPPAAARLRGARPRSRPRLAVALARGDRGRVGRGGGARDAPGRGGAPAAAAAPDARPAAGRARAAARRHARRRRARPAAHPAGAARTPRAPVRRPHAAAVERAGPDDGRLPRGGRTARRPAADRAGAATGARRRVRRRGRAARRRGRARLGRARGHRAAAGAAAVICSSRPNARSNRSASRSTAHLATRTSPVPSSSRQTGPSASPSA